MLSARICCFSCPIRPSVKYLWVLWLWIVKTTSWRHHFGPRVCSHSSINPQEWSWDAVVFQLELLPSSWCCCLPTLSLRFKPKETLNENKLFRSVPQGQTSSRNHWPHPGKWFYRWSFLVFAASAFCCLLSNQRNQPEPADYCWNYKDIPLCIFIITRLIIFRR